MMKQVFAIALLSLGASASCHRRMVCGFGGRSESKEQASRDASNEAKSFMADTKNALSAFIPAADDADFALYNGMKSVEKRDYLVGAQTQSIKDARDLLVRDLNKMETDTHKDCLKRVSAEYKDNTVQERINELKTIADKIDAERKTKQEEEEAARQAILNRIEELKEFQPTQEEMDAEDFATKKFPVCKSESKTEGEGEDAVTTVTWVIETVEIPGPTASAEATTEEKTATWAELQASEDQVLVRNYLEYKSQEANSGSSAWVVILIILIIIVALILVYYFMCTSDEEDEECLA